MRLGSLNPAQRLQPHRRKNRPRRRQSPARNHVPMGNQFYPVRVYALAMEQFMRDPHISLKPAHASRQDRQEAKSANGNVWHGRPAHVFSNQEHGRAARATSFLGFPWRLGRLGALFLCCLLIPSISPAHAAEVELRLVPFDQPDSTVDKLEKSRPLANPVSTPQGMVMKTVGVEAVTWARNVLLDGKPIFE